MSHFVISMMETLREGGFNPYKSKTFQQLVLISYGDNDIEARRLYFERYDFSFITSCIKQTL